MRSAIISGLENIPAVIAAYHGGKQLRVGVHNRRAAAAAATAPTESTADSKSESKSEGGVQPATVSAAQAVQVTPAAAAAAAAGAAVAPARSSKAMMFFKALSEDEGDEFGEDEEAKQAEAGGAEADEPTTEDKATPEGEAGAAASSEESAAKGEEGLEEGADPDPMRITPLENALATVQLLLAQLAQSGGDAASVCEDTAQLIATAEVYSVGLFSLYGSHFVLMQFFFVCPLKSACTWYACA